MTTIQRCCESYGIGDHDGAEHDGILACGCLHNSAGAHRGACPDFETIRPANGSNRLDDLSWRPRTRSEY